MTDAHFPVNQHIPLLSPVHAHGHAPCELDPPLSLSRSRKPSFRRLSAFLHSHLQADRVHDRPNVLRKSSLPPHVLPGSRIERVVSLEDDLLNGAQQAPSGERKRGWSLFRRRSSEGRLSAPVAPSLLSHGLDVDRQTSPPSPSTCSHLSTVSSHSSKASSLFSDGDGPHTPPNRHADLSETCHSSTPSPHAAEPLPLRSPSPLFPALPTVQLASPSDLPEAKPRCLSSPLPPPAKPSRAAPPVPLSETRMVGPLQLAEDEDEEDVDADAPLWGLGLELLQAHEEKDETSERGKNGSVVELSIEEKEEDGSRSQVVSPGDMMDGARIRAGGALDIATEDVREVVPWSLDIYDLFPVPSDRLLVPPQQAPSFDPASVPLPTPTLEEAAELAESPVRPLLCAPALASLAAPALQSSAELPVNGDDAPSPSSDTLDLNSPSTMSQFDPATVTNIAPVPLLYAVEYGYKELSQGDAQELAVSAAAGVGGEDTEASEGLFPGVPLEQQRAVAALVALLW